VRERTVEADRRPECAEDVHAPEEAIVHPVKTDPQSRTMAARSSAAATAIQSHDWLIGRGSTDVPKVIA